jgi:hypothetical protein
MSKRKYESYSIREVVEKYPPFVKDTEVLAIADSLLFLNRATINTSAINDLSYFKCFYVDKLFTVEQVAERLHEIRVSGFDKKYMATKDKAPIGVVAIPEELISQCVRSNGIGEAKNAVVNAVDRMSSASLALNTRISDLAIARERLATAIKLEEVNIAEMIYNGIDAIHKDGHWKFLGISGDRMLTFVSDFIYLRYEDEQIPLGHYLMRLDLYSRTLRMFPLSKMRDGYFHPHLSLDGNPCWGDAAPAVTDAFTTMDMVTLTRLSRALLTTFGHNPWINVTDLKENLSAFPRNSVATHRLMENTWTWNYRVNEMPDIIASYSDNPQEIREMLLRMKGYLSADFEDEVEDEESEDMASSGEWITEDEEVSYAD